MSDLFLRLHRTHRPPRLVRSRSQLWLLWAYAHTRFYLGRRDWWLALYIRLDMHLQRDLVPTVEEYRRLTGHMIEATRRRHARTP